MAAKTKLTVVTDDHRADEPKTVRAAAEVSELALLKSLRSKIATDIDKGVPPHALAPLARQLRELDRDIRAIESAERGDEVSSAVDTPDEEWVAR